MRYFNDLFDNTRHYHDFLDYFFNLNSPGYFHYSLDDLFDYLYFWFDTVIVVRNRVTILLFNIYRNFLSEIDRVTNRNFNWSLMNDGNVDSDLNWFVSFFDDLIDKGNLLYLVDNFDYFLKDRFFNDPIY